MIFAFNEDGTLDIVKDINEARKEYEAIDVEGGKVVKFYNESGVYLKPVFAKPNITKKHLFGLFSSVEFGEYGLVAYQDERTVSFQSMLQETQFLNKNMYFESIEGIKKKYNKT